MLSVSATSMMTRIGYITIIFVLLILSHSIQANTTRQLPVEAFAKLPAIESVQLSPSGNHLAMMMSHTQDGVTGTLIKIINTETFEVSFPLYSDPSEYRVNWFTWANDEQILVSTRFASIRFYTDIQETRLLKVNINGGKPESVFRKRYLRKQKRLPAYQDRIVDLLPNDPDHILINLAIDNYQSSKVVKVNLKSKKVQPYSTDGSFIRYWVTDQQERIRAKVWRQDTDYKVLAKAVGEQKFSTLWEFESFSEEQVWPMGFGKNPNELYIRAYLDDRLAVYKINLTDPELHRELILSDSENDIEGSLIYSEKTGEAIGVRHKNDNGHTYWDPDIKGLQAVINKALPDTFNTLYSLSKDQNKYVLFTQSDSDSGSYLLGNRKKGSLDYIALEYPELTKPYLSDITEITYQARDGVDIDAYLTLPKQRQDKKIPFIIFPHGGPHSSSGNYFDYWSQFMAHRGYGVMQMNFRGSSGQGFNFKTSGLKNWGQEMQLDVEDGTRWLIENGYADPENICIVGASYGGYAALMEAASGSELYQCAISFAGVSDLYDLIKSYKYTSIYEIVKEQIGQDRATLKKFSPIKKVKDINIPILMVHGDTDNVVDVEQSREMVSALRSAKKDITYIEQKDGDHYLGHEAHRIEFFRAMDTFLAEHLK